MDEREAQRAQSAGHHFIPNVQVDDGEPCNDTSTHSSIKYSCDVPVYLEGTNRRHAGINNVAVTCINTINPRLCAIAPFWRLGRIRDSAVLLCCFGGLCAAIKVETPAFHLLVNRIPSCGRSTLRDTVSMAHAHRRNASAVQDFSQPLWLGRLCLCRSIYRMLRIFECWCRPSCKLFLECSAWDF